MNAELREMAAQNKLAEWTGKIAACRNSGQPVKTWCRENGVCEQTYYKWLRHLVAMAREQQEVQFAEITPVQSVHSGRVRDGSASRDRSVKLVSSHTILGRPTCLGK